MIFIVLAALQLLVLFNSNNPETTSADSIDKADTAWMIVATAFVLFMTPGLSFFYGGMVSVKNVISTMLQSFIALGLISLLWYLVGVQPCLWRKLAWIDREPNDLFRISECGVKSKSRLRTHLSVLTVCVVSIKICHHHARPYHGKLCRAGEVHFVPDIHVPVLIADLLPPGTLDLASGRIFAPVGSAGFCRRYGSAHVSGLCRAGGSFHTWKT